MYGLVFNFINKKTSLFIYDHDEDLEDVLIDYKLWPNYRDDDSDWDDEDEDEDDWTPPIQTPKEEPKIDQEKALEHYEKIMSDPDVLIHPDLYERVLKKKDYKNVDYLPEDKKKEIILGDYLWGFYEEWVNECQKRAIMCEYTLMEDIYPVLKHKTEPSSIIPTRYVEDYEYSGDDDFWSGIVTMDDFVDNLTKIEREEDKWRIPIDW